MKNFKRQGKHMKRKGRLHISNASRFYALMCILLGIGSIFIFRAIGEIDMTGSIFVILLGILGYIGSFGEDK